MTKRCLSRTRQSFQKRSIDRGREGGTEKFQTTHLSKYDSIPYRSFPTVAKLLGKSQERYSIGYIAYCMYTVKIR